MCTSTYSWRARFLSYMLYLLRDLNNSLNWSTLRWYSIRDPYVTFLFPRSLEDLRVFQDFPSLPRSSVFSKSSKTFRPFQDLPSLRQNEHKRSGYWSCIIHKSCYKTFLQRDRPTDQPTFWLGEASVTLSPWTFPICILKGSFTTKQTMTHHYTCWHPNWIPRSIRWRRSLLGETG